MRQSMFPNDNPFGDIRPETQEEYRRHALAVIAAMREPTDEMLIDDGYPRDGRSIMGIWQAMIDAALSAKASAQEPSSPPSPHTSNT
jgi:hypothetical protein